MKIFHKLRSLFHRRKIDAEMTEEMRTHLDLQTEQHIAVGVNPDEARYLAQRQFGNVARIQEQARDGRGWVWSEQIGQDLRYAVRQLRRSPGFAAVAIISLALAIGSNTAIFSLYHEVLLKPLPVPNPGELVLFRWIAPVAGFKHMHPVSGWNDPAPGTKLQTSTSFSLLSFEWFRDHNEVFTDVFAFAPLSELKVKVSGVTEISAHGQLVSGGYYRGLGIQPALGRLIDDDDDRAGAAPVAVISEHYWRERFGRDPAIVGRAMEIDGVASTIIGVTPREFTGTLQVGESPDVFLPLVHVTKVWPQIAFFMAQPWRFWFIQVMGRLKPGIPPIQAQASLEELFRRSALDDQATGPVPAPADVQAIDAPQLELLPGARGLSQMRHVYAQPLDVLQGLAAIVLVVACLNVAQLSLTRGTSRRREIATRLALGAGRARIARQLLLESGLIAGGGALLGLAFASWGKDALVVLHALGQESQSVNLVLQPRLDLPVLGFTIAVALATTALFGLVPAWQSTRLDLRAEFAGGTRGAARPALQLGRWLMVLQVALSLMLLVGAGLMTRTLRNLRRIDVGFSRERLLLFRLDASGMDRSAEQALALYRDVAAQIGALPSVEAVSYSSIPLLSDWRDSTTLTLEGDAALKPRSVNPAMKVVTDNFFTTLKMRLLAGRTFDTRDRADSPRTAVVNQALARELFGTADPLGRRVIRHGQTTEIVGVVNDAKYADVREPAPPTIYFAFARNPPDPRSGPGAGLVHFTIRTIGNPELLLQAIREMMRARQPDLPVIDARTQVQQIDRQIAQPLLFARLSDSFGVVVGMLVCMGLYGLISYAVIRRTGEIGIRMALGAQPGGILGMILRDSIGLVLAGMLLGTGGTLAAGQYLASRLYGISSMDPTTYAIAGVLMLGVGVLAGWIPARRAAGVDPVVALRAE
ncbi:MAG TPA: ABC transporter permease [Lacunisphaera sp.]|jgi:predicted permease